jgi:ABC-2 type transport system ATP-binding protein
MSLMTSSALSLKNVSHSYGRVEALSALDLAVPEGDIYGFLGLNGAGKTTAIRLVAGLIRLRRGEIELLGRPLGRGGFRRRPAEVFRSVGVLFEDFGAYPYLSGREHLELRARERGLARRPAREEAEARLAQVGLRGWADTRVRKYSLGMRRRLGLAGALLASPRLVILDEPTNGLDPQGISDLRELVLELNRRDGTTFVLSSHILGEVEQLCRRVGIIHRGRLRLQGAVADLQRQGRRRLRASPAARVEEVLGGLPWCRQVERARAGGAGGAGLFTVDVEEADVPRLVRALVAADVNVLEVASAGDSLEAVFHRAVADGEADAGADGAGADENGSGAGRPGSEIRASA